MTGATRGVGNGIARVFASNGARALVVGRDGEAARATARELGDCAPEGADVSYLLADVSRREDCRLIGGAAAERLGGVDVLCAKARDLPRWRARGPGRRRHRPANVPLRGLGTVDEIGYETLFRTTDEAGFIAGQAIVVDGGQALPESLGAVDPG